MAPIERFCLRPVETNGLVLGFCGIKPPEIEAGVETRGEVLEELAAKRKTRRKARAVSPGRAPSQSRHSPA